MRRSPIGREHEVSLAELKNGFQTAANRNAESLSVIALRNSVLGSASRAVGAYNMHRHGARVIDDSSINFQGQIFWPYRDSEHAKALSRSSDVQAQLLAQVACAMCPLQAECGTGPDEVLVKELAVPQTRRRFNGRLPRNDMRFCDTLMRPGRLKKSDR